MKVSNMTSPRTGREVPNQFIISDDDGCVWFQSYKSIIAKREPSGQVTLAEGYWDYSKTTSKYRNEFLGESTQESRDKLLSGEYRLEDLNR